MASNQSRKPVEESVAAAQGVDDRREALQTMFASASAETAAAQAAARTEPAQPLAPAKGDPVKWDGDTKYEVVGGAFTAVVDGDYRAAARGEVVGLTPDTAKRGVDLGVLRKV